MATHLQDVPRAVAYRILGLHRCCCLRLRNSCSVALTPPVLVVSAAAATTSKSVSVSVSSQSATNQLPIILAHWFHTVLGPRAASEHHSPVLKALSHSVTPSIFDRHTELFSFTQYVGGHTGFILHYGTTAPSPPDTSKRGEGG